MHRFLPASALCFCLILWAAAAPAQIQTQALGSAEMSAWVKVELDGAAFLYPPDLDVIEQDSNDLAVGKMDEATQKGVAFGFTMDDRESLLRDIRNDASSFEELGPASIDGQTATHYRAIMDEPAQNMTGTMEIILFDAPLANGDDLAIMQVVVNQDWSQYESLLRNMLFSVTLDPAMFAPAAPIQAPVQAQVQPEPTPQPAPLPLPAPEPAPLPEPEPLSALEPAAPLTPVPVVETPAAPVGVIPLDTTGWTKADVLKCSFLYPPDFQVIEQEDDGVMVGILNEAEQKGVVFGLGKDAAESVLKDIREQAKEFEELGQVTVSGQTGQAYRAHMDAPEQGLVGVAQVTIIDTLLPDGDQIMMMQIVTNQPWEDHEAVLQAIADSVVIDPAAFEAEEEPAAPAPAGYRNGTITLKDARSYRDAVGRGEALEPDGSPDARFILTIDGPGVLTGVRLHNMDGIYSEWDTVPGNGLWALAVYKGRDLLNAPDGSLRAELAQGSNKLDLFVQDNNAIAGGNTTLEVVLEFEDGSTWAGMIFK